jgi:signal transduction histidine kinase
MNATAKFFATKRASTLLNLSIGLVFVTVAIVVVALVNYTMRQQAMDEAESKARILLDRNLATHTYFTRELKPDVFELTDAYRPADYFEPSWMSSTYAVRQIDTYFKTLSPTDYFFKDAAINARNPLNEADTDERTFLEALKADPTLEATSGVRTIEGNPYYFTMRRGETMDQSCLKCHGNPEDAPGDLVRQYGAERSFHRAVGDVVHAVSIRIPLSVAYANADHFSLRLSGLLAILLGCLFAAQWWLSRRLVFSPLVSLREKAVQISTQPEHLGEIIAAPLGCELQELTAAFNAMSIGLRRNVDQLEERVEERTSELRSANQQLQREISVRKQAEEALRESETRFRTLYETIAQGVVYQDAEGTIIAANPAAEGILGLTLDQLQGRTSTDPRWKAVREDGSAFPGETHPAMVALQTGRAVRDVIMGVFDPVVEEHRWIRVDAAPQFRPGESRPYQVYATFDDITEGKRAEDALRESEERYRRLFESMLEGFAYCEILCDDHSHPVDWVYLDVNRQFERLTGLKNMVGKRATEAIPGIKETNPELLEIYGRVALTGQPERFEVNLESLSICLDISVFSPAKGHFVAVFEDITERKRAEAEKERLQAQLLESQKMEAIGQLAAGIAHDFNNLLTAINGFAELLQLHMAPEDRLQDTASRILHSGQRAATLVSQLLGFGRRQMIAPRMSNLNEIVAQSAPVLRHDLGATIELTVFPALDLSPVKVDPAQFTQVIRELALNARRAMPGGGRLTIATTNVTFGPQDVRDRPEVPPGDYVLLAVSDTGVGMGPEAIARIFEPFFITSREVADGVGLRMAAVYGIVKQNDGHIFVESQEGAGTTFKVYLPRCDQRQGGTQGAGD